MKPSELRALSSAELQTELEKLVQQDFNLRMMKGSRQEVLPHRLGQGRRLIARIKTIMAEKQREEGK